jgi:arylsulfatase A-like enzyme
MRRIAGRPLLAIAFTAALAGCGGGGGGGSPTSGGPTPPPSGTPTPAPAVAVCITAKTLCFPTASPSAVSTEPAKPKIIFVVLLDDADYSDFGYYSTDAVTPNIDSVAKDGVRLSRYYAGSAICSPSRAALLTGQSPIRYGITYLLGNRSDDLTGDYYTGQRGLPTEDGTMPKGLKTEGYRSFFVGKWHLGTAKPGFLPGGQGYDEWSVQIGNDPAGGVVRELTDKGGVTTRTEWWSKRAADQIINFLDTNIASGNNVMVQWSPPEPHTAYSPDTGERLYIPPTFDRAAFDRDSAGKSVNLATDRGKLVAMMYSLDAQLGRVLDYIKQKNLYEDSLIIVTSDNGGIGTALSPSRELMGNKGSMFEGGIRVPFAASWPKRFKAGTHTSGAMSAMDVYPTLMGLIGGAVPTGIEGQNMASLLLSGTGTRGSLFLGPVRRAQTRRSDETFWDTMALIKGCDKLVIWSGAEYLYDVCKDPNETKNLASGNAGKLASMRSELRGSRQRVSLFAGATTLTGPSAIAANERLNTHQDDLSIYATVNLGGSASGIYNVYRHGDGIDLRIENGRLVASVTGVADATRTPAYRTVTLDAAIPNDGKAHRFGFVIRGYFDSGSTISMYIDGELKSRLAAPLDVNLQAGTSVLAVKAENVIANLGANGLTLSNLLVLTNAIEPDEF